MVIPKDQNWRYIYLQLGNDQAIGMKEFWGQDLGELRKAIMLKTVLLRNSLKVCVVRGGGMGVIVELLVREEENWFILTDSRGDKLEELSKPEVEK